MSISTISRRASIAEIASEMDRRGGVIEKLEARIAELETALRPFAQEAGEWGDLVPDDHYPVVVEMGHWDARYYGSKAAYCVGDQRHARRVLQWDGEALSTPPQS